MRMPTTLGLSLALLVASPAAMAKQHPPTHHHKAPSFKAKAVSPVRAHKRKKGDRHEADRRQAR